MLVPADNGHSRASTEKRSVLRFADSHRNGHSRVECNLCGHDGFVDLKHRGPVRCARCGSLERTRVMGLFIDRFDLVSPTTRILHIAPERGLATPLAKIAGPRCTFADLDPERYRKIGNVVPLDLCRDLDEIADESYDLIIHSHVLEHLPCNHTYVLFHLHRILSRIGRIVCSIPIMRGHYDFATSPTLDADERHRRFGQHNHVCRYGLADLHMTLGKVYNLDEYDLTKYFDLDDLDRFNIPPTVRRGFSPHTVLCLKRDDYLLK